MKDILKKGLLASIGLAAYTKDHVNDVLKELKKRGYTEKEGKKVVDELLKEGAKTKDQVMKIAEEKIDVIIAELEKAKGRVHKNKPSTGSKRTSKGKKTTK